MGDIDFDNMNWGSFKKQFQASKKKLGVSSLEDFANHILDNPKGFRDTTKKRANFYKNVILKKGKGITGSKPVKPEPEPRTQQMAIDMMKEMNMKDRENYLNPPRKKPRPKYRRKIGGSQPSEDQLIDEFMDSFQDARTEDQALADRRAADAELIRNMPTQPNHDRYVFPTLRPPHIAERRTYNTPFNMNQEQQEEQIRKIRAEYEADTNKTQVKRKKGGMMQVSDDENDLLPEATVDQVADVLQGDISDQTHDALMAILPQHGQAADRDRLRDSLVHYGYGGEERAAIMNAYNNLYNAYHTPVGSDDESEMSEYSSSPGVPMVSDDSDMDGGSKKNPKSAFERMEQMIRERDAGLRDANFETEEDKVKARERQAKLQDRLKAWRRERDIYIPHDDTAATILDDDVSSGGRHIVSHTVRPFFAMN